MRTGSGKSQTTRKVAEGSFKAFEVPPTGDETERVLEAFNSMARELERRQNQLLREKMLCCTWLQRYPLHP